ncbi:hypothetical protein [Arsenophonus sp. PmNCSU2021_1]|uniref:hypothetical protein n=1 Tax=Arsenophonus sp. PmNCSU2021_1 TaxID=3118989 RepID=UPI002FF2461E
MRKNYIVKDEMFINALLVMLKYNKIECNLSYLSSILGVNYIALKNIIMLEKDFPKPVRDDGVHILSKKWLLYDVLNWAFKNKELK